MNTPTVSFGAVSFASEPQPVCRAGRGGNFVIPFHTSVPVHVDGKPTGIVLLSSAFLSRDKSGALSARVNYPGIAGQRKVMSVDADIADRFSDHVDQEAAGWAGLADCIRQSRKILAAGPATKTKSDGSKSNLVWSDDDDVNVEQTANAAEIEAEGAEIIASLPTPATAPKAK